MKADRTDQGFRQVRLNKNILRLGTYAHDQITDTLALARQMADVLSSTSLPQPAERMADFAQIARGALATIGRNVARDELAPLAEAVECLAGGPTGEPQRVAVRTLLAKLEQVVASLKGQLREVDGRLYDHRELLHSLGCGAHG